MDRDDVHKLSKEEFARLMFNAQVHYYKGLLRVGAFWLMVGYLLGSWRLG